MIVSMMFMITGRATNFSPKEHFADKEMLWGVFELVGDQETCREKISSEDGVLVSEKC